MTAGQLAFHLARSPLASFALSRAIPLRRPRSSTFRSLRPAPRSSRRTTKRRHSARASAQVRRRGHEGNLAHVGRRKGNLCPAARNVSPQHHAQPLVPASRPVHRLPAHLNVAVPASWGPAPTSRRRRCSNRLHRASRRVQAPYPREFGTPLPRLPKEVLMCPVCVATTAAIVAGSTAGTGGIATFLVRLFQPRKVNGRGTFESDRGKGDRMETTAIIPKPEKSFARRVDRCAKGVSEEGKRIYPPTR